VNRLIKNQVFKKRKASKPQISALAARLIKDKAIVIPSVEVDELRIFTDDLLRVAKRGDAASRRRVSSLLQDREASNILFADIAPNLTRGNRSLFQVSGASRPAQGPPHNSIIELVMDDVSFRQGSMPRIAGRGKARSDIVPSEKRSLVLEDGKYQEAGRRTLAVIDGRLGAEELKIIGKGLGIPVRAPSRPDHWTLGLGAVNEDRGNPILLRVVRGSMETDGVKIELAWRGKGPSRRLVAQVKRSIKFLEAELAEKEQELSRNEAEAASRIDAALVRILQGVPGRATPAEPPGRGLYPSTTPDVAKLLRMRGLNVDFEHDRLHREYLTLHAAEHWLPIVEVSSSFLRNVNKRIFTRLVEDFAGVDGQDSVLHVQFRIRNDDVSVREFCADGPVSDLLTALGNFEDGGLDELET
jgi:large subunit ribosomal protein L17